MKFEQDKIALLLPSLQSGGMERVMSILANYLVNKKRVEVHLVLYGKSGDVFYDIDSRVIVHKAEDIFDDKYRIYHTIKRMRFLRREVKKIRPLSVLSFGTLWNRFVLLSLLGTGIPVYVSNRGNPQKKSSHKQELLAKFLYPLAAGIVAQTGKAKAIYKERKLNKNIKVIGNPIREILCRKDRERENIVISVGRLIDTKNFDRLIDIFALIDKKDWKLIIVGGDANKQKNSIHLQRKIDELGMQEQIILAGTQKDVESYLLRAKIFAFTSNSEGFPNVIGEAMSAGLPVVAYDCMAGPSDMIVEDKNGYLIPLFDDKKFEVKLTYLMKHEEERKRMGAYAKEHIQQFSVESIGQQFYDFMMK